MKWVLRVLFVVAFAVGARPVAADPPTAVPLGQAYNGRLSAAEFSAMLRSRNLPPKVPADFGEPGPLAGHPHPTSGADGSWARDALHHDGIVSNYTRVGVTVVADFMEMAEAYELLNPDDAAFEPNYNPDGMPTVPSGCPQSAVTMTDCEACYSREYYELSFIRRTLERLRAVYGRTQNYVNKSIAFGDNVSGIHGLWGIAWQNERGGIEEAMAKVGVKYDEKYRGLMANLLRTLQNIGKCEEQHFGVSDWYDRYGYIYYTFMEDRYRR